MSSQPDIALQPIAHIQIPAGDGAFDAYVASPLGGPAGVVVVLHEVFGINHDMRETCHELANAGFLAICPDLFWRQERNVDLSVSSEPDWQRGLALYTAYDVDKGVSDVISTVAHAGLLHPGLRAGVMGFCLGGLLAFLTAARSRVDAAVAYHGGRTEEFLDEADDIRSPLQMHLAERDEFIDASARTRIVAAVKDLKGVEIHSYPDCHHAFSRHDGQHYDADAALLSRRRTLDFLREHLVQSKHAEQGFNNVAVR